LRQLVCGSIASQGFHEIEVHLNECEKCQTFLEALRLGLSEPSVDAPESQGLPTLPDVELLERLGKGGMGAVFKGRQRDLGRFVAVKLLLDGQYAEAKERARFLREAQAVASLQHPNIIQILQIGQSGGRPFLILEFAEGGSLAQRLQELPLSARVAAQILETLARAVEHIHGHNIIHRDLKPANILLFGPPGSPLAQQVPKISDFGLAKQFGTQTSTESGTVIGTPGYMAPEQADARHGPIDARTDVYGLGAILYELLTGRPPFWALSPLQTLQLVMEGEPARPRLLNPAVPRDLETICLKCLKNEPACRYPSASALAEDLRRFLVGKPVQARRVSPLGRAWRWGRRNGLVAGLLVFLMLSFLGGFAGVVYQWRQTEAARRAAEASADETVQLLSDIMQVTAVLPTDYDAHQLEATLAPLQKADLHGARLLAKRPDDTRLRLGLTNVRNSLGSLHYNQGKLAETRVAFQSARELWEPLVQQQPGKPEYRDQLVTILLWQAERLNGEGALELELCLQADALWCQVAAEQPGQPAILAKAAGCRYILLEMTAGRLTLEQRLRVLADHRARLAEAVAAAPGDRLLHARLALVCLLIGECHY
jgi:tRNA A-37 threonylcarbamoyl transferase component Bud32